jgi:hypothetical protein
VVILRALVIHGLVVVLVLVTYSLKIITPLLLFFIFYITFYQKHLVLLQLYFPYLPCLPCLP